MDLSNRQDEHSSSAPSSRQQTFPPEILDIIFTYCIEDDGAQEPSMVWYIYWESEVEDEITILVPYVVMDEYEPTIPDMKRMNPNPVLGVCRQSRFAALNPDKGRYASLAILSLAKLNATDGPCDHWDQSHRVIVHPYRDVFVFTAFGGKPSTSIPIFYESLNNAILGVGEDVACEIGDGMHLYDEDTDLLQAAVQRTGFRFRHVPLPTTLTIDKDDSQVFSLWVLLHLCEDTGLRAHQFHVFLNFDCSGGHGENDLFPGAAPFVHISQRSGFFAIKTYPYATDVKDETQDCQRSQWPDCHRIFEDREELYERFDTKPDVWVGREKLFGYTMEPQGKVPFFD